MKPGTNQNKSNPQSRQIFKANAFRFLGSCLSLIFGSAYFALGLANAVAFDVPAPPAGRQAKVKTVIGSDQRIKVGETVLIDSGAGYTTDPDGFVVSSAGSSAIIDPFALSGSIFSFVQGTGANYSQDAIIVIGPPRKNDFQQYIDGGASELVLASGLYFENAVITNDITIRGQGVGKTIVSGGLLGSVFRIEGDVTVSLKDMTIIDGLAYDANNNRTGSGGGIFNFGGDVTVTNCEIKNCVAFGAAGEGGGIFNRGGGVLRLIDSIISNNEAGRNGGGISNSGINTSILPALGNATQPPAQGLQDFFTNVSQLQFPTFDPSLPSEEDFEETQEIIESLVFGILDTFEDAGQFFKDAIEGEDFLTNHGLPKMVITNSRIERNKVKNVFLGFGGGIHNDLGQLTIDQSIVQLNKCNTHLGSFGGGISSFIGALEVTNTKILGNEVTSTTPLASGGAIHSFACFVEISDSELNDNVVQAIVLESGGGLKNTVFSIALIDRCSINGNNSGGGGGISNDYLSFLKVDESTIMSNTVEGIIEGNGGGLRNENGGQVLISNSTFADNSCKGKAFGGGVFNYAKSRTGMQLNEETQQEEFVVKQYVLSTVTMLDTTLSGNFVDGEGRFGFPFAALGGGIYNGTDKRGIALVNCLNCTIVDNEAFNGIVHLGGGLYNTPAKKTFGIVNKRPSLDITLGYSAITLGNTLIGLNEPDDCFSAGLILSLGYNMDSDTTAAIFAAPTDFILPESARFKTFADLKLSTLRSHGGETQTHALLNNSPVLDAGPSALLLIPDTITVDDQTIDLTTTMVGDQSLAQILSDALPGLSITDQRGVERVDGGSIWDIGAFESVPPSRKTR